MKFLLSIMVVCFALPAFAQEASSPETLQLIAPQPAQAPVPAAPEEYVDPEASPDPEAIHDPEAIVDPEASHDPEATPDALPSAETAPAAPIVTGPVTQPAEAPIVETPVEAAPAPAAPVAVTPAEVKPAAEAAPAEAAPAPADAIAEDAFMYDVAVLQGLNKVTARISEIEAPVGTSVRFGNLDIVVKRCWKSPATEQPENAARVEILDRKPDEAPVELFNGWMFSSSPSLSGLEHPVYDLVVLACEKRKMTPGT